MERNGEGYPDPTAARAIGAVNSEMPVKIKEAYANLNSLAGLIGLEIVTIKDKRTGKYWRARK